MKIRRLWIQNFRGVRELDWTIPIERRLVALIGPGDSSKSTILDAIYFLLSDRRWIPFADTDFYEADVEKDVLIKALVINVPAPLRKDSAFGLWLSGVNDDGEPEQDPTDGVEPALMIQLRVDASLEPHWSVIRTDGSERSISSTQRRALSTFKVDDRTDAQLRWSQTSPLGRMSSRDRADRDALAAASRSARQALEHHGNSSLSDLVHRVQARANEIGGGSFSNMNPGLDTSRASMGATLALYEGVVPLTSYGLGSRRLASLAVQQLAAEERSVVVVDEIESGLEPHRAVRLMNYLLSDEGYSQVFVTTHSPVIVEQAKVDDLATVRNRNGEVRVTSFAGADTLMQRLRRTRPSSLLAQRILVVEGKTEHGLLLACIEAWDRDRSAHHLSTSAGEGVAIQDAGGGSEVAPRTGALAELGYDAAGLLDNDDRGVDAAVASAASKGLQIIRWDYGLTTEAQICSQLDAEGLTELLDLGIRQRGSRNTVLQDVNSVGLTFPVSSLDVTQWGSSIEDARQRIAAAATKHKWFKDVEGGRALGSWLIERYDSPGVASTVKHLEEVRSFVYSLNNPVGSVPHDNDESDG